MSLHRLSSVHLAVARYDEFRAFYRRFGLEERSPGRFWSVRGGEQLRVDPAPANAVVEIGIGADSADDLEALAGRLEEQGVTPAFEDDALLALEPASGVRIRVAVAERIPPDPPDPGPRSVDRSELVARTAVRPVRLGHVALGCPDVDAANAFFIDAVGMRVSDQVIGATFLRFETDHHNLAFLKSSHTWLHHMAWKVRSVDEVGYGAMQLIDEDPERDCYGLGRHAASANYFWYLRDPAGSLAEYYHSEFDDLVDDPAFWNPDPDGEPLPVASWGPRLPQAFFVPSSPAPAAAPVAAAAAPGEAR